MQENPPPTAANPVSHAAQSPATQQFRVPIALLSLSLLGAMVAASKSMLYPARELRRLASSFVGPFSLRSTEEVYQREKRVELNEPKLRMRSRFGFSPQPIHSMHLPGASWVSTCHFSLVTSFNWQFQLPPVRFRLCGVVSLRA